MSTFVCISSDQRFTVLGTPKRIWAVPAIHGEAARLQSLHDGLYHRIEPGDRIIYLGNYTGYGSAPCATVDELLTFRRMVLAIPGVHPQDIVYLRGMQEDLWQKLLQLPFIHHPVSALMQMLNGGLGHTLAGYGINPQDGLNAGREGVMALVRWTAKIREAVRRHPGHELFASQLRRAAFTAPDGESPLLFVHAGLDPSRPLETQDESFWQAGQNFKSITDAYQPFRKVVRGFDPDHNGMHLNCVTATLDDGCGFGGPLVCAGFDNKAALFDLIEA